MLATQLIKHLTDKFKFLISLLSSHWKQVSVQYIMLPFYLILIIIKILNANKFHIYRIFKSSFNTPKIKCKDSIKNNNVIMILRKYVTECYMCISEGFQMSQVYLSHKQACHM